MSDGYGGRYNGPTLRVEGTCVDCKHVRCKAPDRVVRCAHESHVDGPRAISEVGWWTPAWCPLYDVGVERLIKRLRKRTTTPHESGGGGT